MISEKEKTTDVAQSQMLFDHHEGMWSGSLEKDPREHTRDSRNALMKFTFEQEQEDIETIKLFFLPAQ